MEFLATQASLRRSERNAQNPNFPRPSTEMKIDGSAVASDSESDSDSSEEISDSEDDDSGADSYEQSENSSITSDGDEDHDGQIVDKPAVKRLKSSNSERYQTPKFQAINRNRSEIAVEVPITSQASGVPHAQSQSSSLAKPSNGLITPVPSSPPAAIPHRPKNTAHTSTGKKTSLKRQDQAAIGATATGGIGTNIRPAKRSKTAPPPSLLTLEALESPIDHLATGQKSHGRGLPIEPGDSSTPGPLKHQIAAEKGSPCPKEDSRSAKKRKRSISVKASGGSAAVEATSCADLPKTKSKRCTTAKSLQLSTKAAMNCAAPRDSKSTPKSKPKAKSKSKSTDAKPPISEPGSPVGPIKRKPSPQYLTDLPDCPGKSTKTTRYEPPRTIKSGPEVIPKTASLPVQEPATKEAYIKEEEDANKVAQLIRDMRPPGVVKWGDRLKIRPDAEALMKQSQLEVAKLRLETDGIEWQDDLSHKVAMEDNLERAKTARKLAEAEHKRAEAERQQTDLQRQLAEMGKLLVENEKRILERKIEKGKKRGEKEKKRLKTQHEGEKISLKQKIEALEADIASAKSRQYRAEVSRQNFENPKVESREEGQLQTARKHRVDKQRSRSTKSTVYVVKRTSAFLAGWVIAGVKSAFPSDDFNLYRHTLGKQGNSKLVDNWAVEFTTQPLTVRLSSNGITIPNTPGRRGNDWWCFTYKEDALCSFCKAEQHEALAHCPNLLFEMRSTHGSLCAPEKSKDGSLGLPQNDQNSRGSDGPEIRAATAQLLADDDSSSLPVCTEEVQFSSNGHSTGRIDAEAESLPEEHGPTTRTPTMLHESQFNRTTIHSRAQLSPQPLGARDLNEGSTSGSQPRRPVQESDLASMLRKERSGQVANQPQYRRREVQPLRTLPGESGLLSTELRNPTRTWRPSNLVKREVAVAESIPACVCRLLHDYFATGLVTRPCLGTFQGNEVEFWENIRQIVNCRGHDKEMITYCQGLWDGEQARRSAFASSALEKSPPPQLASARQPSQPPAYGSHLTDQFIERGPRRETVYGRRCRETIPAEMFYGPSSSRPRPSCVGPEPAPSQSMPQYRQTSFRDFEGFLSTSQSSEGASAGRQQRMIELD
ncbi:MAG: hypothetical protein M1836_004624 [Candelina mexicana]|nr:MAG: hypothetical protein M1836_004624 [Candelina mexicana]